MIKLIDILKEDTDRDIQVLDMLLYKWINYAGSQDTLPQIEELSKKLKLNTLPSSNVVYRVVPMVGEDIKDYPPKEIIKIDRDKRIVSTTADKSMIDYFSEGADWAYVITYKPHVILNFDELEKKYGWTGDVGEGEILIDAKKSQVIDIKRTLSEADPKVGTGKKPKGSGRRLYTDENPKDTVRVKFKTAQDIKDTLSKTTFKSKPHARKSQIINLIHQRVRAAYGKAKDPEVKARLKRALDYIEKRKEASKKKTQQLQKETSDPQSGKSSPYGSGYKPVGEASSFAQQAAIAIAKKKSGKYDKEGKRIKK